MGRSKNHPRKKSPEPTLKEVFDRIRPTASTRRGDKKKAVVVEEECDGEREEQPQVDHDMVDASLPMDDDDDHRVDDEGGEGDEGDEEDGEGGEGDEEDGE